MSRLSYELKAERDSARLTVVLSPWFEWLFKAEAAYCDHHFEPHHSHVGPDSGYESFVCRKCGTAHNIIFY